MRTYKVYATNEKTLKTKLSSEFSTISSAFDYAVKNNKIDVDNIYSIGYPENKTYLSRK